jgi:hypothetical protein
MTATRRLAAILAADVEFGFDLRQAGEIGAPIGFGMVVEAWVREGLVAAPAAQ